MSNKSPSRDRSRYRVKAGRRNEGDLELSEDEKRKGFARPFRDSYLHKECGTTTSLNGSIAETYARDPKFYGATFCVGCGQHYPVSEFLWVELDGTVSDSVLGS